MVNSYVVYDENEGPQYSWSLRKVERAMYRGALVARFTVIVL